SSDLTRSTFGYFIKADYDNYGRPIKDGEFFALFSYDRITKKGKDGKDEVICATELFLFSPCPHLFFNADVRSAGDTNLGEGYAIGSDGSLLSEVPLDLAQVSNFPGEEKQK